MVSTAPGCSKIKGEKMKQVMKECKDAIREAINLLLTILSDKVEYKPNPLLDNCIMANAAGALKKIEKSIKGAREDVEEWIKEEKDNAINLTDKENLEKVILVYKNGDRITREVQHGRMVVPFEEKDSVHDRLFCISEYLRGVHPSQLYPIGDTEENKEKTDETT